MGMPGGWELIVIVGIVVLLFGGKKIPELAKGLGKGIKDFKKAVKEDETATTEDSTKEIESKTEKVAEIDAEIVEKKSENA